MNLVELISWLFLLFALLALFIMGISLFGSYNSIIPKQYLIVMVVCLAVLGMCIEPKPIYDLARHYEIMARIKNSKWSLQSFLNNGYLITDQNYKYTYIYNILIYIIGKYFSYNMLPFIAISVSYGLFANIAFHEFSNNNRTGRNIILSISICIVLMPYLYVYSGIRNALAASIIAFGIYRFYKCEHKILDLVICTIVAILIHPISAAVVPFILLSKIKPGIKGIIVTLALPSIVFAVMEYFRLQLGNEFLFKIAAKYYNYTLVRNDNQGRIFLYSTVILLILFSILALYTFNKKNHENKSDYSMLNLIIWYSMFSLGYINSYEMIIRLPYNIAILSPVLVNTLFNNNETKTNIEGIINYFAIGIIYLLAIIGLYENIAWLL